jgi:hypothetical protein
MYGIKVGAERVTVKSFNNGVYDIEAVPYSVKHVPGGSQVAFKTVKEAKYYQLRINRKLNCNSTLYLLDRKTVSNYVWEEVETTCGPAYITTTCIRLHSPQTKMKNNMNRAIDRFLSKTQNSIIDLLTLTTTLKRFYKNEQIGPPHVRFDTNTFCYELVVSFTDVNQNELANITKIVNSISTKELYVSKTDVVNGNIKRIWFELADSKTFQDTVEQELEKIKSRYTLNS